MGERISVNYKKVGENYHAFSKRETQVANGDWAIIKEIDNGMPFTKKVARADQEKNIDQWEAERIKLKKAIDDDIDFRVGELNKNLNNELK